MQLQDRFWNKVNKSTNDSCWEWIASCNSQGYGWYRHKNKSYLAHRFIYISMYGDLSSDLQVCHSCDNPKCVNPNHLFVGTNSDNVKDMMNKERNAKGEKIGTSKLTKEQVLEIRSDTRSQNKIANSYNIDQSVVSRIKNRHIWTHI